MCEEENGRCVERGSGHGGEENGGVWRGSGCGRGEWEVCGGELGVVWRRVGGVE